MEDNQSCVWMLGTPPEGKGGISSVIQQYQAAGFFDGGSVHFEPTHHRRSKWGRMLPFLHCAIKLWPALLVGRVELIHAHTSHGGSFWRKLLLVLPAIILDVPAIVHLHGSNFMDFHSEGGRWRRHWMRFLFRRSFRVIALSEEWKQWVLSVEPNARVEVVFNSLASQTGIGVKTSFHQYPTVLFLGTIGERKGSFDLLRAFAAVKSQVPQARLVVGGDGDVEGLLAKAKTLHISDAIDYVGWVDGEDKSRLMSESWVFALPSYHEGLPMAILEAMAFARAVVSCPVGGIPQAVEHGQTGYLVQPGDVATLAESLVRILSDRNSAERMGCAGRLAFEGRFSHEANLPRLLTLYREAGVANVPPLRMKARDIL